jgi:hypothetical protein
MGALAAIAAADADVFPGFFAFAADAFCSFVLLDASLRESSGLAAVRGRGGAMVTYPGGRDRGTKAGATGRQWEEAGTTEYGRGIESMLE